MAARRAQEPVKTKKRTVKPTKTAATRKKSATRKAKVASKKVASKKVASKKVASKKVASKKVASKKVGAPRSSAALGSGTTSAGGELATRPEGGAPSAKPSERLLAARAELPTERPLTDEEREAMAKVSETARRFVGATGSPTEIVASIAKFVEEVRLGKREEPKSQDVRLGLGVLWGEQLRAQVGWRWVHLTYPDGFASYALVPDDRAFACFPLNRVPEALRPTGTNTSAHVFESIRENALPTRRADSYLAIG